MDNCSEVIQEINIGMREHYGIAPKCILMSRKFLDVLKKEDESNTTGIKNGMFFGIPIRIDESIQEFSLRFYVDPMINPISNKENK